MTTTDKPRRMANDYLQGDTTHVKAHGVDLFH